jgi:hypothetical protein
MQVNLGSIDYVIMAIMCWLLSVFVGASVVRKTSLIF